MELSFYAGCSISRSFGVVSGDLLLSSLLECLPYILTRQEAVDGEKISLPG